MLNQRPQKSGVRPIRMSSADIDVNARKFMARAAMTTKENDKLELKFWPSKFNYTQLSNEVDDYGVRILDGWNYCDDDGNSKLQFFSVHRSSRYFDGKPGPGHQMLEQCESCGTFKERRAKGQMGIEHHQTLTEQAMLDQSAFDIRKLACAKCSTTYRKSIDKSDAEVAAKVEQLAVARKKTLKKANDKRYAARRETASTMSKSFGTVSTAPSLPAKRKVGRPYICQLPDSSEDEFLEALHDPARVKLGVRWQPNPLQVDADSDVDTLYVASQGEQEQAAELKLYEDERQIESKVRFAPAVKVPPKPPKPLKPPKPKVESDDNAIKFAFKGVSIVAEKDVFISMVQLYASLVRGGTGFTIREACKADKSRVFLVELDDAGGSLSRRPNPLTIPSCWKVQKVTFAWLLAFVGGTALPEHDFVQPLQYQCTWTLNLSLALQGHVKQRVYTTPAALAKYKAVKGQCLYISLDLALELYRLNPSTSLNEIPASMRHLDRLAEQKDLIELIVDSMKLNRKGQAYYTQLVYVFDRTERLLQQSDYHLLFHINAKSYRYTVSVPKYGDTVWFSNAFEDFATKQHVVDSADLGFRNCRQQYCKHSVSSDQWREDDSHDVFAQAKLPMPPQQERIVVDAVDHSITFGERRGIVVNHQKKQNDSNRVLRQDPVAEEDNDGQSTVANETNPQHDEWEDDVVNLLAQCAKAHELDEKKQARLQLQNKLCQKLKADAEMMKSAAAEKNKVAQQCQKEESDYYDYLWSYRQIGQHRHKPIGSPLSDQDWLDMKERFLTTGSLAAHIAHCSDGCFQCLRCDINSLCGDGLLHIPRDKTKPVMNVLTQPVQQQYQPTHKKRSRRKTWDQTK